MVEEKLRNILETRKRKATEISSELISQAKHKFGLLESKLKKENKTPQIIYEFEVASSRVQKYIAQLLKQGARWQHLVESRVEEKKVDFLIGLKGIYLRYRDQNQTIIAVVYQIP